MGEVTGYGRVAASQALDPAHLRDLVATGELRFPHGAGDVRRPGSHRDVAALRMPHGQQGYGRPSKSVHAPLWRAVDRGLSGVEHEAQLGHVSIRDQSAGCAFVARSGPVDPEREFIEPYLPIGVTPGASGPAGGPDRGSCEAR